MQTRGQKKGLSGYEVPVSPKDCEPQVFGPSYCLGYFGDLALQAAPDNNTDERCHRRLVSGYLHWLSIEGGHNGIGPPSKAGTWGTAAITYVPTSPIMRSEVLIARFMGFSLTAIGFRIEESRSRPNYKAQVNPSVQELSTWSVSVLFCPPQFTQSTVIPALDTYNNC